MSTDEETTPATPEEENNLEEDAVNQFYGFVAEQMRAGVDKSTISKNLEKTGIDKDEAQRITTTVTEQITAIVDKEQITPVSLSLATMGGLAAALTGGAIWGALVIATDYEIGIVAWGIGLLSGYAVAYSAMGSRGVPMQVIATISSALGIITGKYFIFYHYFKQSVEAEYGSEVADQFFVFSEEVINFFVENITSMLGVYDLLWIALAIGTAWFIPKGSGIKLPMGYRYIS